MAMHPAEAEFRVLYSGHWMQNPIFGLISRSPPQYTLQKAVQILIAKQRCLNPAASMQHT